jgi:prepilin-type processing-associated H-X9-DG protein
MGLAMHNYLSSNGGFPPAKIFDGSCQLKNDAAGHVLNTTAYSMILNYIEQVPLYNSYNFLQASSNQGWWPGQNNLPYGTAYVNTTTVGTMINTYWCPSDQMPRANTDPNSSLGPAWPAWRVNAMQSNYYVSVAFQVEYYCPALGTFPGGWPRDPASFGAFYNDTSTSIADIKDGTSNTFLDGESVLGQEHVINTYSNPPGFLWGPYWGCGELTSTHGVINPPTGAYGLTGYFQALLYMPNSLSSWDNWQQGTNYPSIPYVFDFSSNHPGGVNMGMCDGSVRWIKNSISIYTWWALATRNGGELLDASLY